MIGNTPRRLALSLYKHLITDKTWSEVRARMGYRRVERPLLVDFAGTPLHRRAPEFELVPSPAELDPDLAHRAGRPTSWPAWRRGRTRTTRIEFEIAVTCRDFAFAQRSRSLREAGFSKADTAALGETLGRLTAGALDAGSGGLDDLLALTDRFLQSDPGRLPSAPLEHARALLSECIAFGTLPCFHPRPARLHRRLHAALPGRPRRVGGRRRGPLHGAPSRRWPPIWSGTWALSPRAGLGGRPSSPATAICAQGPMTSCRGATTRSRTSISARPGRPRPEPSRKPGLSGFRRNSATEWGPACGKRGIRAGPKH